VHQIVALRRHAARRGAPTVRSRDVAGSAKTGRCRVSEENYLSAGGTVRSWLFTRDHKRIGVLFFVANAVALAIGGAFALLLRTELLSPRGFLMGSATYNRVFTMHGVIMVWLFMIPSI